MSIIALPTVDREKAGSDQNALIQYEFPRFQDDSDEVWQSSLLT